MKKDIFNGNIKKEYINYVKFSLAFASILFFIFFIFFLLFALLYEKIEYAARILMFVFSAICLFASFLYPAISIYAISYIFCFLLKNMLYNHLLKTTNYKMSLRK